MMLSKFKLLVPLMCLSACMNVTSQSAHSMAPAAMMEAAPQAPASAMPKGPSIEAPRQYQDFCARTPEECVIPHSAEVAAAIAENQHLAHQMITPTAEETDVWQSLNGKGKGDCEDFALTLRKQLRAKFPEFSAAFLLATAYTEQDQYHAVLTIETNQGTIVCDIRYQQCAPWENFPYHWRLREVAGSDKWQELGPYRLTADEMAAATASHEAAIAAPTMAAARATAPSDEQPDQGLADVTLTD